MFSALKKLARSGDDRCPAPIPMSSSLQKKFSKGVHFNMKILIKGDRNVGKSCLLQRLQGGQFIEEYVPTDQIQVAPIHWTYKNSDYIVKVEVWEVVDKGRTKKKPPVGLKLENQAPAEQEDGADTPVLDATFLDVYKNASGVILMFDITKPWTFEYVVKELSQAPADLPVVVLGNHCDMQHHRQVHPHHIDQALHQAKLTRTAPVRYAESSMRNGFGLRLLHKFLSIPFLRLQKTSLLEQLQRNQRDMEETEKELNDFQNSEEAHYDSFVDRLANKRRQNSSQPEPRVNERSPSIVIGAGKPIIPHNVNPLLAQSVKSSLSPQFTVEAISTQNQYVSPELLKPKNAVSMDMTPTRLPTDSVPNTPTTNTSASGALDEFYAGTLDSSFLDDFAPIPNAQQEITYESDSDDGLTSNPKVTVYQEDLEVNNSPPKEVLRNQSTSSDELNGLFKKQTFIKDSSPVGDTSSMGTHAEFVLENDFPMWARDSSARRSPEGGEDPDVAKNVDEKGEKKHKKKKSKDRGDHADKTERKEKKSKHKKSHSEKRPNPQQGLLEPNAAVNFNFDDYDRL